MRRRQIQFCRNILPHPLAQREGWRRASGIMCSAFTRQARGPLAQSVEHQPFKLRVAGSIPARLTTHFTGIKVG